MFQRIRDHAQALGLGVAVDKLKNLFVKCRHDFTIYNADTSIDAMILGKGLVAESGGRIAGVDCFYLRCRVCDKFTARITGRNVVTF